MKVIFLITFPPAYHFSSSTVPAHRWKNNKGRMLGIWREDWGHILAEEVKKSYPEIAFEVWRPDYRAEKEYVHVFNDGVVHRSFPARRKITFYGLKLKWFYNSPDIIKALGKYIYPNGDYQNTICHIPVDYSFLGHSILKKYGKKLTFIHTSHLNPAILLSRANTKNPCKWLHRQLIWRRYDRYLSNIQYLALSSDRIDFFNTVTPDCRIYTFNYLWFDLSWSRNKINNEKARDLLGLPTGIKVLLSSSRIVPEKQLDKLIGSLSKLRNSNYICLISGTGEEKYINYLQSLVNSLNLADKIVFTGYLDETLFLYYCAADLFVSTSLSEGGPVSVLKALALGVPVMATDTGIAAYILKKYRVGKVLDSQNSEEWSRIIDQFLAGNEIKSLDPVVFASEYDSKNAIEKLVDAYQDSIERFIEQQGKS